MDRDRHGTALAAFVVGTVLAGGNAVGVRVSNRELDPLWGAGLRFLLAASLLGAVMVLVRLNGRTIGATHFRGDRTPGFAGVCVAVA